MRVLVADDEIAMTRALEALLKREHYSVDVVNNGQDALDYGLAENYDALVLDIMMPKLDGLQVLAALREKGIATPVLLLTAKSQIEDRVAGLASGADDYLPKPFAASELLARVRAMLRRKENYQQTQLEFENLTLDVSTFELGCEGNTIRLVSREFQMLQLLMQSPGVVISTDQFMERIWGWDSDVEVSIVWVYISNLRKKLEKLGANVTIKAVRGVGYCLEKK